MPTEDHQSPPIALAPPPWHCKCSAYWLPFYASGPLPANQYAPLEASSPSWTDPHKAGEFSGGLGMIQIVRYSETPVGSYDELLIIPGNFHVPGTKEKHLRITRIYVSQKETCFNGRKNWNIPKHLARFSFTPAPSSSSSSINTPLKVQVFPPSPSSSPPFFTATLTPITTLPALPFSTKLCPYLGLNVHLVQPPLPSRSEAGDEILCGTKEWVKLLPYMATSKARGIWVAVEERKGGGGEEGSGETRALLDRQQQQQEEEEGWFPSVRPWKVGLWLEDATLVFEEGEVLNLG